ncbi:hypothetical protein DV735_g3702, partial [Chaetothyriales sp. CBS 134920]
MNFISNLVNEYTDGQQSASVQQTSAYSGYSSYNEPPRVSYPWEPQWDDSRSTWIFINRETNERTYDHPGQGYGGGAIGTYEQAGGAGFVGYEGERNGYEQDKYRVESDVYNAPDNAARWTGEKVQEVEDIPGDVDRWGRRKVQEVEDIPEDVAGWTGRKVQQVEDIPQDIAGGFDRIVDAPKRWFDRKEDEFDSFGNRIHNAYDQGQGTQEWRDDYRYDSQYDNRYGNY